MSTIDWAIFGLFYTLTIYAGYAVWVHPETTRYWYRLVQFTHREISPREYTVAVWVARALVTFMFLIFTWVAVVLALDLLRGLPDQLPAG